MAHTVIVHISDDEPILGEMDELPAHDAQIISIVNPRLRDGKDLQYLGHGVVNILIPLARVNFIQVMPGEDEDQIIGFVRE